MYCSPLLTPPATRLPPALRDWLGARLCPRAGAPAGQATGQACLFVLGQLGDFVLALSALRLVIAEHGASECLLVITPAAAALAAREFPDVPRLVVPGDAPSLRRDIMRIWREQRHAFAARRFATLVCFSHQRSLYYELALSWVHAGRDLRLTRETYPPAPHDGLSAELLANWRVAELALGRAIPRREILPRLLQPPVSEDGRLLVFPYSRDPVRSLPAEILREILRRWRQHRPAPIVFGGSPADRRALETLAGEFPGATVETPDGVEGLLIQIAGAGLIFAADSAPAHIATALDKRAVIMTSRSFYGYAQPWARSDRQQVFVHGAPADEVAQALLREA